MLNSIGPILALVISIAMLRKSPPRSQVVGLAVAFAMLNGRVRAPRSALVGYLVPVVAVVLGIAVRGESVGPLELAGTAMILLGAALISRR